MDKVVLQNAVARCLCPLQAVYAGLWADWRRTKTTDIIARKRCRMSSVVEFLTVTIWPSARVIISRDRQSALPG